MIAEPFDLGMHCASILQFCVPSGSTTGFESKAGAVFSIFSLWPLAGCVQVWACHSVAFCRSVRFRLTGPALSEGFARARMVRELAAGKLLTLFLDAGALHRSIPQS